MLFPRNPNITPLDVVSLIPAWLEIEKDYANEKHGHHNPQMTALQGGATARRSSQSGFWELLLAISFLL
jgi:hypothetical protein